MAMGVRKARSTTGTTIAAASLPFDRPREGVEVGIKPALAAWIGVEAERVDNRIVGVGGVMNVFESTIKPGWGSLWIDGAAVTTAAFPDSVDTTI